jgi:hypothetical protein
MGFILIRYLKTTLPLLLQLSGILVQAKFKASIFIKRILYMTAIMKAPEGCASISVNGVQFPVDEFGYAEIPLDCTTEALERGFTYDLSAYKPPQIGKVEEPQFVEKPFSNEEAGKIFGYGIEPEIKTDEPISVEKQKKKIKKDA